MFVGFKKLRNENTNKIHLSINSWSTLCGTSADELEEIDSVDSEDDICKNCRSSIISRGKSYGKEES